MIWNETPVPPFLWFIIFFMENNKKDVELVNLSVVTPAGGVGARQSFNFQNAELFAYPPEDLEAPSAGKTDCLFDWQFENEGAKSINRFGGIEKLMQTLGTNPKTVGIVNWE